MMASIENYCQRAWKGVCVAFIDRLKQLVDEKAGGNKAEFARLCRIEDASVRQYFSGSKPSLDNLIAIAQACNVSLDWLALGRKSENSTVSESSIVTVKRMSFDASAGNGGPLAAEEEDDTGQLPREIFARLQLRPDRARLLTAVGDSMRPTIEDGEPLLVDTGDQSVVDGRIYVFTIGDQVLVKRLRRRGSRLLMRSDNRDLYPDEEEVPTVEPVRIIGRVRWVGRSL